MPRRKQDCPKRMKWELENLAAAAAAVSGAAESNIKKDDSVSDEASDDADKTSGSSGSPLRGVGGSESPSSSPSLSPSPGQNGGGAALDFSRRSSRKQQEDRLSLSMASLTASAVPLMMPVDSPLDLSVSHPFKKDEPPKKIFKWGDKASAAAVAAAAASWNGNSTSPGPGPDMTSKALEKMSELSRVGQAAAAAASAAAAAAAAANANSESRLTSPGNRSSSSSSWQAQWLAQSSCGTRDVLRCVCCRLTFPSLSALSVHMKEAKHGPPLPNLPSPKGAAPPPSSAGSHLSPPSSLPPPSNSTHDSSLLLKETVHLPRKLVRGQDVWLGKGAEQTRQILKCMWCGQSFRSLAEMTAHMQQTQHYTNIISQEQLISWRSSEDKSSSANSHVSAVLTCKVCDQAFSSLKELSNHMVKNSHYKEHIMRSITESGSRRRQSREKRKKSLPVRKLLELERANTDMKKEIRISCEKCNEKIPAPAFVEHLRVCEQKLMGLASPVSQHNSHPPIPTSIKSPNKMNHHSKEKDLLLGLEPPQDLSMSTSNASSTPKDKEESSSKQSSKDTKESSSVLNAIEKMIEKSFDYRTKGGVNNSGSLGATPPVGTSILKRLGIDESVDYTKPLVDPSVLPIPPRFPQSRPRSVSSEKSDDTGKMLAPTTPSPNNSVGTNPDSVAKDKRDEEKSPRHLSVKSPEGDSSGTEDSLPSQHTPEKSAGKLNSLSALSSMFESIGGGGGGGSSSSGNHESAKSPTPTGNSSGSGNGGNFPSNSHHPLAALQKLCDKTENTPAVSSRPTSTSSSNPQSSPGIEGSALLGLNWSVNDGENVFKCTFCDTPFLSKGAYRHHLAKMHFVKEKSPTNPPSKEDQAQLASDSPTSKFIKYSELAKQLSSK